MVIKPWPMLEFEMDLSWHACVEIFFSRFHIGDGDSFHTRLFSSTLADNACSFPML